MGCMQKLVLAILFCLGISCHPDVSPGYGTSCEVVREDQAISLARSALRRAGKTVDGLPQVDARLHEKVWVVAFWRTEKSLSVGGPGFEVRLDCVKGAVLNIGDFQ
jgi:hypothetical protein